MSTTEPGFYNAAYGDPRSPSLLQVADSPWLPVYREAAAWIAPGHAVVDLGCGTGRFLGLLAARGHYGHLAGVDFSHEAISEASRHLSYDIVADDAPPIAATLEVGDLREWRPQPTRPGNTTYVCFEVLEHLANDRDLLKRVPPGHELVFSVPNYDSAAHLRVFRNLGEIFRRYDALLAFRRWSLIELGGGRVIHLLDTVRRTDSW